MDSGNLHRKQRRECLPWRWENTTFYRGCGRTELFTTATGEPNFTAAMGNNRHPSFAFTARSAPEHPQNEGVTGLLSWEPLVWVVGGGGPQSEWWPRTSAGSLKVDG